jgi:DNA-binding transcriptional ArsR family regulator
MMAAAQKSEIVWEQGTAYDFLASLFVLHFPEKFGLRGAWAAGVRSRLRGTDREFLELVAGNFLTPLGWLHSLPEPKDADGVLMALKRIPAEDRLAVLQLSPVDDEDTRVLLTRVWEKQGWDQNDLAELLRLWRNPPDGAQVIPGEVNEQRAEKVLDLYAAPAWFGERYLASLSDYQKVFFAEEEKRITPRLAAGLEKVRKAASAQGEEAFLKELLGESGSGRLNQLSQVVLAPSYWCSSASVGTAPGDRMVVLFAVRLEEESLVPGEVVPEDLVLRLKAMTDPTRMRILRYLLQEQLTPAELARRLRLRAPTVTHHLQTLKSSGMVQFVRKGKNEHLYFARMESIKETYVLLREFLEQDVSVVEDFDFFDNELL